MEIIETTKYNNEFVILTTDELKEFSDKKLEIKNDLNYLYTDLIKAKLETL